MKLPAISKRLFNFIFLFVFLFTLTPFTAQARMVAPPPDVLRILNGMTPEERVGQIFLVTFNGADTSVDSQLYNLITRYHVGGVTLLAQNDNFPASPGALLHIQSLINAIQQLEWESASLAESGKEQAYVPLFIGIAQEGNGYPTDQILGGLTPLPSEMAIGATWNTDLAAQVGEVRGEELAALGFNFYLGPSLDVLETPAIFGGDLDTRVFGGDPFWVGEMGRAYVAGLHTGSEGKLMVVAKHFPGVGGSDRSPEDEISTVRKSIEQLKQIELAPFFAVTGNAASPESTVDGLLVSHIRYQGFQGNIRATTRPISLDPQAFSQILVLPQFSAWYGQGGLMVSDNLGTRAVREFYTSGGGQFSARIAARDAFLAGNDILYLGNIASTDADSYVTTVRVIEFFSQKYREDPAFAQRVDAAVARILAAKLKLYESFSIDRVLISEWSLNNVGTSPDVTFEVARSAATLISPDLQELSDVLPLPPQPYESIVFLTDIQSVKQCSACAEQTNFAVDSLQQNILRLYGPKSGNQISNLRMTSHSFQTLQALLDNQNPDLILGDLTRANWVVISLRNASQGQPALISRFLRERPDLLRNKKLILFSFGAPYYFDTTTISKFTAYFALYSKQPQFVDVAARLLFQELTPQGASPVSVPGVGYELISVTSPAPDQVIPLALDLEPSPVSAEDSAITPEATPIPLFRIGDTIAVRAGIIKDHNGHTVPDGTVVRFSVLLTGESGGIVKQLDAVTTKGVARAAFGLDKPGLLEISVASEPAVTSQVLMLDVSQSGAVAITVVAPQVTEVVSPTPLPPVVEQEDPYVSNQGYPLMMAWILSMLFIGFSVWLVYGIGARLRSARAVTRWTLGIALGGLAAYNFLVFGWMEINQWILLHGISGIVAVIFIGELIGFIGGLLWARQS